ncbi:uncharacterized protein [Oscarella lobularis]|uniref:uncharacterized protein isoform X2 n=1 Tax=Oscarella lobularis TaxID=121494 RepID=UPI003313FDA6
MTETAKSYWDSWFKEEDASGDCSCPSLAFLLLPVVVLKARKFSALFTLGSLFILGSFSVLWGPWKQAKHLFSMERLPFTASYLGCMVLTLYFALWVHSTLLTIVFSFLEAGALLWYVISYVPGGVTGMTFVTKLCGRAVKKTVETGINSV